MRIALRIWVLAACVLILTGTLVSQRPADSQPTFDRNPIPDSNTEQMQRQQRKELNKKRQEDLKRDTDKLLQLATELKLYVDKSNENVLSLEVLKKAEEIEKLSKQVQKKMRAE